MLREMPKRPIGRWPERAWWLWFAEILLVVVAALWSRDLRAAPKGCDGPPACCPATLADHLDAPVTVKLGVLLVGLYEVEEKSGTWKADFYLTESWQHEAGFTPATEIANEVERQSEQFDATELRGDFCVRTRRIRSTLHTSYNLRAFPFDRQRLTLQFSDAWFSADEARYSTRPSVSGLDAAAQEQLSNWKVTANLDYLREKRTVQEAVGDTPYDYATSSLAPDRSTPTTSLSSRSIDHELTGVIAVVAVMTGEDERGALAHEVGRVRVRGAVRPPAVALDVADGVQTNALVEAAGAPIDDRGRWIVEVHVLRVSETVAGTSGLQRSGHANTVGNAGLKGRFGCHGAPVRFPEGSKTWDVAALARPTHWCLTDAIAAGGRAPLINAICQSHHDFTENKSPSSLFKHAQAA